MELEYLVVLMGSHILIAIWVWTIHVHLKDIEDKIDDYRVG